MIPTSQKYAKVVNNRDLIRDRESKGVLNTNNKELEKYKQERAHRLKLKQLVDENAYLKNELSEIKSMLATLLGQKDR
jgi:hypothetical protein